MAERFFTGQVVRFMHYWAAEEVKSRAGVVVAIDSGTEEVIVAPGRSDAPRFYSAIRFPQDFDGYPPGADGFGFRKETFLDLDDLGRVAFERASPFGRYPLPVPIRNRILSDFAQLLRDKRISIPPSRRT